MGIMKNIEKQIRAVAAVLRDKQNGTLPDAVTVEITPEFLENIADELESLKKQLANNKYRETFGIEKIKKQQGPQGPHDLSGDSIWKNVRGKGLYDKPDF